MFDVFKDAEKIEKKYNINAGIMNLPRMEYDRRKNQSG